MAVHGLLTSLQFRLGLGLFAAFGISWAEIMPTLVVAAKPLVARNGLSFKPVSFTMEDYCPRATSLQVVAEDCRLMHELGITTRRDNFA